MTRQEAMQVIKCNYPSSGTFEMLCEALDIAIECIEKCEEIVHCKDCKHWVDVDYPSPQTIKMCDYAKYMVSENGYCVYGDRRGENE